MDKKDEALDGGDMNFTGNRAGGGLRNGFPNSGYNINERNTKS
jgi:hypothetical protein